MSTQACRALETKRCCKVNFVKLSFQEDRRNLPLENDSITVRVVDDAVPNDFHFIAHSTHRRVCLAMRLKETKQSMKRSIANKDLIASQILVHDDQKLLELVKRWNENSG